MVLAPPSHGVTEAESRVLFDDIGFRLFLLVRERVSGGRNGVLIVRELGSCAACAGMTSSEGGLESCAESAASFASSDAGACFF